MRGREVRRDALIVVSSRIVLLVLVSLGLPFALHASPAEVTFRSGTTQVTLIELYSSEGCSSCPSAEKWLGGLREDPDLWKTFVPIAFHVNYWDRLGWRDVFATPEFTEREYRYSRAWRASSVYTPCFVRNGEEWRPRGSRVAAGQAVETGELSLTHTPNGECRVTFVPAAKATVTPASLEVSVALLGGGIVSPVRAGENSGRELHHEFVARALRTTRLERGADGSFAATLTLTEPDDRKFPVMTRRAIAAWVLQRDGLTPLQATGGWLD